MAALARGGRISVQQVATDAFGNALGSSLMDWMQRPAMASTGNAPAAPDWAEQSSGSTPYDDTYRQAKLERMQVLARSGIPDSRTAAQVQEQWIAGGSTISSSAAAGDASLVGAPSLLGRNVYGGYSWSSGSDTYPFTLKTIRGTALESMYPAIEATNSSAQDYSLFSRASMNEYWSGEGVVNWAMRAVGNAVYDVANALTPAASTPEQLQRAQDLKQLRQSFSAARSSGDIATMQNLQIRHAEITSAEGNPSMLQVSMASDILRAQTAAETTVDRNSLGLAAGAAITQGFSGIAATSGFGTGGQPHTANIDSSPVSQVSIPKPRIDLTDAFSVEHGGPGKILLSYGRIDSHGLIVEVDSGVLSFDVKASQDAAIIAVKGSGTDMAASAMQRLSREGVEVTAVDAYWLHPSLAGKGNAVNWSEFSANRAAGFLWKTPRGRLGREGFLPTTDLTILMILSLEKMLLNCDLVDRR